MFQGNRLLHDENEHDVAMKETVLSFKEVECEWIQLAVLDLLVESKKNVVHIRAFSDCILWLGATATVVITLTCPGWMKYLLMTKHWLFPNQSNRSPNFQAILEFFSIGWFFNCSSRFSVPKWKMNGGQSEILFHEIPDVQKILVGWTIFFLFSTEIWAEQLKKHPVY